MKKICVVTGSRAEYGLLRWLIEGIHQSSVLDLQLVVTGMHLSPEFGSTVNLIEEDGFSIDRKVEMLLSSDTSIGITKSMGLGVIGFADVFAELKPNLLLILGDRYEIYSAAISAMIARIPIAHLHGGETTEGSFDEMMRHSITKMSHLHFVASEEYKRRVIQLGERVDKVFNVGGLGIDNILRLKLLAKEELERVLDYKFQKRNLLVTFHPVTLDKNSSILQMRELLRALEKFEDTGIIFTYPNSDTEGRALIREIEIFCLKNTNAKAFQSLGQQLYLSCIKYVDGVVGNSSSGLMEVASLKKGTINIGDRQRGRLRAASVIDCEPNTIAIQLAIQRLFSFEFQQSLNTVINPYGSGGASEKILRILESASFDGLIKKRFYDITI